MVTKEDGSKWACESCIRGHRVSGCSHTERELFNVPKKGRPVTQCHHCRQERKKRSAHVKCDCGETDKPHHPKEKCIHLRESEERAKAELQDETPAERDPIHLALIAEEQGCCCHHGGKCSCSLVKKELGGDIHPPHGPAVKPRLEQTNSEGSITVFANGHHKPVHRKNHAAHEHGLPYKMPPSRSNTDDGICRRNVDSLALHTNMHLQPSAFAPHTSAPFNSGRRKSKSEQPSPTIKPADMSVGAFNPRSTSLDISNLLPQCTTNKSISSSASDTLAMSPFDNWPSVSEGFFDPWSTQPSGDSGTVPNNNPFGVWPTPSDNVSVTQPALTAASSGSQSELDEVPPVDYDYNFGMPSIQEDPGSFPSNDNTMGSYSPQANRRSLPPGFFSNADLGIDLHGNEQASPPPIHSQSDNKSGMSSTAFNGGWPDMTSATNVPQRAYGNRYGMRRASRSLGPSNAPNDDLLRQLFPEIDVNAPSSEAPTSNPFDLNTSNDDRGMINFTSNGTSEALDRPFMKNDAIYVPQSWNDGSMSMPEDDYQAPFDFDQEYTRNNMPNTWSQ